MGFLPPWLATTIAVVCVVLAPLSAVRGQRLMRRAFASPGHPSQSLWMVKGIRGWIIAAALLSFAGGLYYRDSRFVWFGAIFLGEELLETGVMILALRSGRKKTENPADGT